MQRIYLIAISTLALGLSSCGEVGVGPETSAFSEADTRGFNEVPATTTPLDSELLDAVRQNDSRRVLSLLNAGADVNHKDESGFTVLVNALAEYKLEFVEELLARGAVTNFSILIDEEDREPSTTQLHLDLLLLKAVTDRSWNLARKIINQGANINAKDHEGFTVLTTALASLDVALIDLLLSHGAHI